MTIEELFELAKQEIFGDVPDCHFQKVAYGMAKIYYDRLIEDAEAVSQGAMLPYLGFSLSVEKACGLADERNFDAFPDEIKNYLKQCARRFSDRYGHLGSKAA